MITNGRRDFVSFNAALSLKYLRRIFDNIGDESRKYTFNTDSWHMACGLLFYDDEGLAEGG